MTIPTPKTPKERLEGLKNKTRMKIMEHPYWSGCFDSSGHIIKSSNLYKKIEEKIKKKKSSKSKKPILATYLKLKDLSVDEVWTQAVTYLKLKDLSVDEVWTKVTKENNSIHKQYKEGAILKRCDDYLKQRIKKENTDILIRLGHHPEFDDSLNVPRNKSWKALKAKIKKNKKDKNESDVPPPLIIKGRLISNTIKKYVKEHKKGFIDVREERILKIFTDLFLKDREIIEKKLQIAEEEELIEGGSTSRSNRKYEYKEKYKEKCEAGLPTEESVRGCFIYKKNVVHLLIDENKKTKSRILTENDLKNLGTYADKEGKVSYKNIKNFISFYILNMPSASALDVEPIKLHSIKYINKDDEIANYPKDKKSPKIKVDYPKLCLGTKLSWRHPDEEEMYVELGEITQDTDYKHKLEEKKNDLIKMACEIPLDSMDWDSINYLYDNNKKSTNKTDRKFKKCQNFFASLALKKYPEKKVLSDLEDLDE